MQSTQRSVAVYARVSSQRQAQAHTIASQLDALRERIAQDQLQWDDSLCFVDDGGTGSTLLRPAPDRLARKHAHQMVLMEELQHWGIEVVFLNRTIGDSAEDQLLLQVQGIVAEYERAKIQERGRRGKRNARQNGRVSVFSDAPYGYRYVPRTADTAARFEILTSEAHVVKQVFA